MDIFNEKRREAIESGRYLCSVCGETMFFENEMEMTLICPKCGHECDIERYGVEDDDEYEALYPTYEEFIGEYEDDEEEEDEDDSGETYEEVFDELDDD